MGESTRQRWRQRRRQLRRGRCWARGLGGLSEKASGASSEYFSSRLGELLEKALEASSEHFSSRSSVIILEALWEKKISTEVLFHLPSCLVHSYFFSALATLTPLVKTLTPLKRA